MITDPIIDLPLGDILPAIAPFPSRVSYYVEKIKSGIEPFPVWVEKYKGKYRVRDGRHRIEAARSLGRKTIHAFVRQYEGRNSVAR